MKNKVINSQNSEKNLEKREKVIKKLKVGGISVAIAFSIIFGVSQCDSIMNRHDHTDIPSANIESLLPSSSVGDVKESGKPAEIPSASPTVSAGITLDDIEFLEPILSEESKKPTVDFIGGLKKPTGAPSITTAPNYNVESSKKPSAEPSASINTPSAKPSNRPSPSAAPTASVKPSNRPSPSAIPTASVKPSNRPSPSAVPSASINTPSAKPNNNHGHRPSRPTSTPSATPSNKPNPSAVPTASAKPSNRPSPSAVPTASAKPSNKPTPTPSAKPTPTPHIHNYKDTIETIDNQNGTHTIKTIKKCACGDVLVTNKTENCNYKVTYNDNEEIYTCSVCNHSKKVAHNFSETTQTINNQNGTHTFITTKTCACGAKVVTKETKNCEYDMIYNDNEEIYTCKACGFDKKTPHNFTESKEIIDNKNGTHTIVTTKTCACGAKIVTKDTQNCEYDMTFDDTHEIYTCSVCKNEKKEKHDIKTETKIVCNDDGTHTITTNKTCACGYTNTQKDTQDCDYELEFDKSGETRTCKVCDHTKTDKHNLVETEVGTYGDVEISCETCGYTDFIEHTHEYSRYCTDLGANHEVLEVCDICGKEKDTYTESHHFIQAEEGSEIWFCECGAEDYRELEASLSDTENNENEKPMTLTRNLDNKEY